MARIARLGFFAAVGWLIAVAAPSAALAEKWDIKLLREKWVGLSGFVSQDGEPAKLTEAVWEIKSAEKPDGDAVLPRQVKPYVNRLLATREQPATLEIADPVVLRIRGQKLEAVARYREAKLVKGDFDGLYLAYDMRDQTPQVQLVKQPGKETAWRIVDGEQRVSKSRGEYQYEIEQRIKFRLEAASRPGWFLHIDGQGRLSLTDDESRKYTVDLEVEKRYDDLSDGK